MTKDSISDSLIVPVTLTLCSSVGSLQTLCIVGL